MRAALALLAIATLLGSGCLTSPRHDFGPGVVTASNQLAAEAGAEMLRAGGNAIDAAAATQWALEVTEPSMSGLGGGALILLWLQDQHRYVFIDGRELAPASARRDQFLDATGQPMPFDQAERMGIAVGVPGTLRAFVLAVSNFGRMPIANTYDPAIALARDGFPVDSYLAGFIAGSADKLRSWPPSARLYLPGAVCPPDELLAVGSATGCQGGTPLGVGDALVQPDLAATFETLAESGPSAFYDGPIGADVVKAVRTRGGSMTTLDLNGYEAKPRPVLSIPYGDSVVVGAPPPTAGGLTMMETMRILEPMGLGAHGALSGDSLHLFTEASRLAYADRYAYIGDSDVVQVPMKGLLSPLYAAQRRALIDPSHAKAPTAGDPWAYESTAGTTPPGPSHGSEGRHTTHFTVTDRWGNIATVTSTIEDVFGSGILVPGRGILLNNELTDFDFQPGGPNEVGPHKRPRSSMAPTILERDGEPFAAFGSPGGPTITTTVGGVAFDLLEFGMTLPEAVAAPRIFPGDHPEVLLEPGLSPVAQGTLRDRGDTLVPVQAIGNVQGVWLDGSGWHGVADHRDGAGGVAVAS